MKVLIADDDMVSRRLLSAALVKWGYEVVTCSNGLEAYQALLAEEAPRLAILDWLMPGKDGVQLCQEIRQRLPLKPTYVILLTARGDSEDIITGLQSGADDYVTKPFYPEELQARVQVGVRIIELQLTLADRARELESTLGRVKQLQGLLPICSYCQKIRDDKNYWQQIEGYIAQHSTAQFSYSICPTCSEKVAGDNIENVDGNRKCRVLT
jgi:sigma-B regulation protein RsbU (phosphoserine phosphatase)